MTRTRWGKGTRVNSKVAREQILDAALTRYLDEGITRTTVEDVAREARVSRTTVYRYFANRDELLTGAVLREAFHIFGQMQAALADIDDMAEYLVEAMVFCLTTAPRMPLYPLAVGEEGAVLTSRLCISSEEVFAMGVDLLEPLYEKACRDGTLRRDLDLTLLVEWVVRLVLSFMVTPSSHVDSEEDYRRLFRAFVLPALQPETEASPELDPGLDAIRAE